METVVAELPEHGPGKFMQWMTFLFQQTILIPDHLCLLEISATVADPQPWSSLTSPRKHLTASEGLETSSDPGAHFTAPWWPWCLPSCITNLGDGKWDAGMPVVRSSGKSDTFSWGVPLAHELFIVILSREVSTCFKCHKSDQ